MFSALRRRLARLSTSGLAAAVLLAGLAAPSEAALIDIVVIGTWDAASPDPIQNPYGLVVGDRWVMKATYDDAALVFRADAFSGVVSSLDPGTNPGTSFDVIIPHSGGAPNPLTFDQGDHIDIGFAPTAEIMFDGASVANPGNFRNFEIHTEYLFFNPAVPGNQSMHFDTFFGGVAVETDIFNISDGGSASARALSPTQLAVVVNDIIADGGGPYVFDAGTLSQNLNGSFSGGNAFPTTLDWDGGALGTGPSILVDIFDLGLANTTDSTNITLDVAEAYTDFADSDVTSASYNNVAPNALTAGAADETDGSTTFSGTGDDADLAANALVAGFEDIGIEFCFSGSCFLTGPGNVANAALLGITGGEGLFEFEMRITDFAGLTDSIFFDHNVVPEPALALPLAVVGAGLLVRRRR